MTTPLALVVGASRGLGRQIALSFAEAGYNVCISSKSLGHQASIGPVDPNSQDSTLDTVLAELQALPATRDKGLLHSAVACNVREEADVRALVQQVITRYGSIQACVYNPGAIWWSSIIKTPTKRFQLMHEVNTRGFYILLQELLPYWERQGGQYPRRLIVISPPIYSRFIRGKTAYAATKLSSTILALGLHFDVLRDKALHDPAFEMNSVGVTTLWPATAIESAATAAVNADQRDLRHPRIFGDACVAIVKAPWLTIAGKTLLDEDFLRQHGGLTDVQIAAYAKVPGTTPRRIMPAVLPDLRVAEQDDEGDRRDSAVAKASGTAKI
ncbi:hypothetical protein BCR37DRAFT_350520 [Protomyces lactucae-debilis]|uniref:Short chain dehydrogenase n=1 Tax=Protomyces lactucae-debilis TaxID=2754530 RepID=A0A1Y2F2R1_PROLT|nr:uncharacterized protein BCR37DRAFT_350520 [Protomyces lactucae-debilis]ORY78161.1 hypothetical protein BCR37DRAFT_350520 [Protomyces lactucae-debilis]